MKKRIITFVIIISVLAGSYFWINRKNDDMAQVHGKLISTNLPSRNFTTGNFVISWDNEDSYLSVKHTGNAKKILWKSLPGQAFVAAAKGKEKVVEERGSFTIEDKLLTTYTYQTIENISKQNKTVKISGKLKSKTSSSTDTGYKLQFKEIEENQLRFNLITYWSKCNRLFLTYKTTPDEHFFGFGEQYTHFDLKGERVPVLVEEQGIGRGKQPITGILNLLANSGGTKFSTYAPVPHYITSKLNSFFLDTYKYSIFDLRYENRVQIKLFDNKMTGNILYGETPSQLIKEYTEESGRMRLLPEWITSGAILGLQGGTENVRKVMNKIRDYDVPTAAIWLQDWVGQRKTTLGKQLWWNWELDRHRYPGWEDLLSDLAEDNIRILGYVNPYLVDVSEKQSYQRNFFSEAKEKDYLVRNEENEPYMIKNTTFSSGILDLTDSEARQWFKNILREKLVENLGFSGWMADYGEGLPFDAVVDSGVPADVYHNKYPEEWAELNRNAIDGLENSEDLVFFTRSGYRESPSYSTLFWTGDQLTSWDNYDGIKTAVTSILSSGLSGYSFNHSDIGGYTTVSFPVLNYNRGEELLKRWMELSAFTVVYRTHEGSNPDANVQFYSNENTLSHFSRMTKIYKAWEFYRRELVKEATKTGLPVVRHPFIHYPSDPNVYDISHQQFMVGSELMIAPVLKENIENVEIYLPEGDWANLWTGSTVSGKKTVTVQAPFGKPAVFYPEGSEVGQEFRQNLQEMGLLENE